MRVASLLVVAAGLLFASSEAFSSGTSATLSVPDAERGTRFLRSIEDDEERGVPPGVTMNFAGHLRDSKETAKWLKAWAKKGESEAIVAAKLGVASVPQALKSQHENWQALANYAKVQKKYFAKFGTGYQSEKRTRDEVARWVVERQTDEWVARVLGMSNLPKDRYKFHRNYKAYEMFQAQKKTFADLLQKHAARRSPEA